MPELELVLEADGWVMFNCPHCGIRCGVPTVRGDRVGRAWGRDSDDPAVMTLTPSLNITDHWHGFIRAGTVVNA